MATKFVLAYVVLSVVIVRSENGHSNKMPDYVRTKRAKYYSNPPMKFFKLPPPPHLVKGAFSYTPPPNYMEFDDPPYPGFRPSKVSKRHPSNEGLPDKDINNLVKHLSKQDLDKILDIAAEKYRLPTYDRYNNPPNEIIREINNGIYKPRGNHFNSEQNYQPNRPHRDEDNDEVEYSDASQHIGKVAKIESNPDQFVYRGPYAPNFNIPKPAHATNHYPNPVQDINIRSQILSDAQLDTQESMRNNQFSFVESYIQQDLNSTPLKVSTNSHSEHQPTPEEQLPKPTNLREDDGYLVSNTNKVHSFVKPSSYQVENFGKLPLMDYHSKLHSVSSYNVPHYSILSLSSSSPSESDNSSPKLELAPPPSAAKEQSDAHLKAIKIWTHHSKGTAYTLHDDGTLTLEQVRPKPSYGPY